MMRREEGIGTKKPTTVSIREEKSTVVEHGRSNLELERIYNSPSVLLGYLLECIRKL